MKISKTTSFILFVFIFLPVIFFYKYFFTGKVPFSGNLLTSFYSPWKEESYEGFGGGIPNKPIGFDNIRIFLPNIQLTVEELKHSRLPLWNPFIFSGNSHIGMYQTAIFYPFSLVFLFLPLIDAWSVLVIIQPVLAVLFTYLFLRSLKLPKSASMFGGLVFAYSGWMISWWEESLVIEHSILWLPLALFSLTRIWQTGGKTFVYSFLLFSSLLFSLFAGFFQTTVYLFLVVTLWHIFLWIKYRNVNSHLSSGLTGIFIFVLALGAAGVQWLPAIEAFARSPRTVVDVRFLFESYLMPWQHLITFLVPDFWGNPGTYNYIFPKAFYHEKVVYIGVIAFLFFLVGLLVKGSKTKLFWGVLSILFITGGFNLPTSWLPYTLHIPVLGSAQPGRIFSVATFCMSVVSAFGFYAFFEKTKETEGLTKKILFVLTLVLILLAVLVFLIRVYFQSCRGLVIPGFCETANLFNIPSLHQMLYMGNLEKFISVHTMTTLRNIIPPFFFLIGSWSMILILKKWKRSAMAIAFGLTILSSFYFAQKYVYFSERQFTFPQTPLISKLRESGGIDRVWGYGNGYIDKNFLSFFRIYSPEGYAPFFASVYARLLNTIRTNGIWSDEVNRADVDLSPTSEKDKLLDNPYRRRLMQVMGVAYIIESKVGPDKEKLTMDDRFPASSFQLIWENDIWRIWKFLEAVPRINLVYDYLVESDMQKAANILFDESFNPKTTVIVDKGSFSKVSFASNESLTDVRSGSQVDIARYEPTVIEVNVEATGSSILFISDTFDTGWKATVDGQKVDILRADIAFRGVAVSEGKHIVRLAYDPDNVRIGMIISLVSLISFIGYCMYKAHVLRSF